MSNNLRVVYINSADEATTLTASSTAGSLTTDNLQNDIKSKVWRSTESTATLTVEWPTQEIISVVALPICSLSSAATMRVRLYVNSADASPAYDSGYAQADPAQSFDLFGWGATTLGVNAYAYGGSSYGVAWFDTIAVQKVVIDIDDSSNPLGYIEASRLVIGTYWSPAYNADYGAQVSLTDSSKQARTDAGDLRTDRGTIAKTLKLNLSNLSSDDRNVFWNIMRGCGMGRPVFLSLSPQSDDSQEEQIFQIYGKFTAISSLTYQFINQFNTSIDLEEI